MVSLHKGCFNIIMWCDVFDTDQRPVLVPGYLRLLLCTCRLLIFLSSCFFDAAAFEKMMMKWIFFITPTGALSSLLCGERHL